MEKTFIGVRDVDEETFRKFRSLSVERRMKLGEALTKAMLLMIEKQKNNKKERKCPKIKPFPWGKGSERTSMEVDEIVYGAG
jgi:hypothetical protein